MSATLAWPRGGGNREDGWVSHQRTHGMADDPRGRWTAGRSLAEHAYGARHEDAVHKVPRDMIPDDIPHDPGSALQLQAPDGSLIPVTVTAASDELVTLDANHPLAGKDLIFAIEVVAIG